jgi:peptidoglycan/LPS O-acetylase OafA/YrhL
VTPSRLRAARRAAFGIAVGLTLIGSRPWLDGDQARSVAVRWAVGVTPDEQGQLARRFSLRRRSNDGRNESGDTGRTVRYDLLRPSSANIRELVRHPSVEDTSNLDRQRFVVLPDADEGDARTGLAWRLGIEWLVPLLWPVGWVIVFVQGATLLQRLFEGSIFSAEVRRGARLPLSSERLVELDALRAVAALAVVCFHFTTAFGEGYGHPTTPLVRVPFGHYGVHLFFAISGLVILLTIERSRSAADFLLARVGRLYPAYLVAVTLTFAAITTFGLPNRDVNSTQYVWNLSMLQRFFEVNDVDGAYWSLQVELAFYLLMVAVVLLRLLPALEPVLLGWLLLLSLDAAPASELFAGIPRLPRDIVSLFGYAPFFIIGMVTHLRRTRGTSPGLAVALIWALAIEAAVSSWPRALAALAIAVVCEAIVCGRLGWLAVRPLVWLGAISYPLYLVHQNIGYIVLRGLFAWGVPTEVGLALAICLVIGLAALLHHVVEVPGQALTRKLRRRVSAESERVQLAPTYDAVASAAARSDR